MGKNHKSLLECNRLFSEMNVFRVSHRKNESQKVTGLRFMGERGRNVSLLRELEPQRIAAGEGSPWQSLLGLIEISKSNSACVQSKSWIVFAALF